MRDVVYYVDVSPGVYGSVRAVLDCVVCGSTTSWLPKWEEGWLLRLRSAVYKLVRPQYLLSASSLLVLLTFPHKVSTNSALAFKLSLAPFACSH